MMVLIIRVVLLFFSGEVERESRAPPSGLGGVGVLVIFDAVDYEIGIL